MATEPMTPAGVAAKQSELNALSDSDLQAQANIIRSDFAAWINDNFSLSTDQQTYLSGISSEFMAYAAPVTAFAVENRLAVKLAVSGTPSSSTYKLIHINDEMVVSYNPGTGFTAEGSLNYEFVYET